MLADLLFPDFPNSYHFLLTATETVEHSIVVDVSSLTQQATCPLCGQPSRQVRGRYVRRLRDLPWANRPLQLRLCVRKFSCRQPDCPRRIFTERLPELVRPFARATVRMETSMRQLAVTAGG